MPNGPARQSTTIFWSQNGRYLFAHDQTAGSQPLIRWFELHNPDNELNEMSLLDIESGHTSERPAIKTSPDSSLVAFWDSWALHSQRAPKCWIFPTPTI